MSLSDPHVSLILPSGTPTAGQTYSLTCSVQLPPYYLTVEPSIVWTWQDDIFQNNTSQQLYFNSLKTSDSGQYTRTVTITITNETAVSGEYSIYLVVTSK